MRPAVVFIASPLFLCLFALHPPLLKKEADLSGLPAGSGGFRPAVKISFFFTPPPRDLITL
jgi:hypothetical protein